MATTINEYLNKVTCIDCLELMDALPPQSVDMILIDPPYAVHEAGWDKPIDIPAFWKAAKRVIKPRRAIVITCVMRLAWQLIAGNPDQFKYDWVMNKNLKTDFLNAKNKPMRSHEHILVFSDGTTANKSPNRMSYYPQSVTGKKWRKVDYARTKQASNFGMRGRKAFSVDRVSVGGGDVAKTSLYWMFDTLNSVHPNQKPIDGFEFLIKSYTLPNEIVLDCFSGSGTTGLAARNCGRQYILGDTDAGYCAIAEDRLRMPFEPKAVKADNNVSDLPLFRAALEANG